MNSIKTSVVICGAGPTGLILSHLLAQKEIDCVVLEKLDSTMVEPRAINLDGEALRVLQKLNLVNGIEDDLLFGLVADYVNGEGKELFRIGRPEFKPYGFSLINSFDQPLFDRYLAAQLSQKHCVDLRFRHTLLGFEQNSEGVKADCLDGNGNTLSISADYLVACDGGRSTVRSLLEINMQGETNPQPWLVIDTKDSHLNTDLDCRFFCDPKRPGMTIRKSHGERRWEWMLMPGEDRDALLDDATINALIEPYTDISKVEVYRKKIYDFHALIADQWRVGRVFLAGDAAHMTPPFAGQGLNSGIRDVANLSWKLAAVIKQGVDDSILKTYETDRKGHAQELIETALTLGQQIQPIDEALAAQRDAHFALIQNNAEAIAALESDMSKSVTARQVDASLCVPNATNDIAGKLLIQPLLLSDGHTQLLDEHLGSGFNVFGLDCDPIVLLSDGLKERLNEFGTEFVTISSVGNKHSGFTLQDNQNELVSWLGAEGPMIVLIRPDRFVMACSSDVEAEQQLNAACDLLIDGIG